MVAERSKGSGGSTSRYHVSVRIAVVAIVALAVGLFVADHAYSLYDDAYIYFRYVENLLGGNGFRFNAADPPVEAFSSPMYLLLLAAAGSVATNLETITQVYGTLFLSGAVVAAAMGALQPSLRCSPRSGAVVALAVTLVLALDHYVLLNAVTGLETALAALVVMLIALAALREGHPWLRTLLVLGVATRPECLVFVFALPLLPAARRMKYWAPIVAALVAMTAVRWVLFDDVLPNTYWAKSGGTLKHATLGLQYLGDALRDYPTIALAPLALLIERARQPVAYALVASAGWCAFFLRSGGDSFAHGRLVMPVVPLLTLLGLAGLVAATDRFSRRFFTPLTRFGPLIAGAVGLGLGLRAMGSHALGSMHGLANVTRWKEIAHYLARRHPGATIATVPIGALSYYSKLHVVDLVGLASRTVAKAGRTVPTRLLRRGWIGHERHNTEWVLAQKPDLIVFAWAWRKKPWSLREAKGGFYAERLLLREIRRGMAPYRIYSAKIAPGVYWLMLARRGYAVSEG